MGSLISVSQFKCYLNNFLGPMVNCYFTIFRTSVTIAYSISSHCGLANLISACTSWMDYTHMVKSADTLPPYRPCGEISRDTYNYDMHVTLRHNKLRDIG